MLPDFRWILHEVSCFDLCEPTTQLVVREDVKASIQLFSDSLSRHLGQTHFVIALLLSNLLLSRDVLCDIAHLVASLFVFLAQVFLLETFLVLDNHVDRIVHHALAAQEVMVTRRSKKELTFRRRWAVF